MKGFFDKSERAQPIVPRCSSCGLHYKCRSPRMPVTGKGERGVLVVVEAPGRDEDQQGTQLIGQAGQLLRSHLEKIGVDLDRDCWKTNALTCWPGEGNPTPTKKQLTYCLPNLLKTIQELNPRMILLLGGTAVQSLIGHVYEPNSGAVGQWVGWQIPYQKWNTWICPTYDPATLPSPTKEPVPSIWFDRHLEAAFELEGRPWDEVPDYRNRIEIDLNGQKIEHLLESFPDWPDDPIAFDYETTCLKPDGPEAEIVSCSVAWKSADGVEAIAFPWTGRTKGAMGEFLNSPVPKIAANLKFEERWTWMEFGYGVRNWKHDTMQSAHVEDNRPGITGLTFQAFTQLGQEPYDTHIKPFLQSTGPGKPNRIRELKMKDLLLYNGMDALCEFEIAMKQMKRMGVKV